MKIRSVHPSFFTDPIVSSLTPLAQLLYIGLWCYADDYGRGRYIPKAIEGSVFPHTPVDISALLSELIGAGRIVTYEAKGELCFAIPRWDDYQKPRYRAQTTVPAPPGSSVQSLREVSSNPVQSLREVSPEFPAGEGEGEGEGVGEGEAGFASKHRTVPQPEWEAALSLADDRIEEGYEVRNREAFAMSLVKSEPERVRQRAIQRTPLNGDVSRFVSNAVRSID